MSFVKADDIISLVERMLVQVWKKVLGIDLTNKTPFQRMTFSEAISKVIFIFIKLPSFYIIIYL
jgi:aspartyl-tRNA synthetase